MRLSRATRWLAAFAGLLGLVGLLGNLLGSELLTALVAGRPRMRLSTALLVLLSATRVVVASSARTTPTRRLSAQLMAAAILLFGVLVTSEYLFDVQLGIDWEPAHAPELAPFAARASEGALRHLGRPSPLTVATFALLGAAMLLSDVNARLWATVREWLCLTALFFAFVSLVGHAFGAGPLYVLSDSHVTGVALPTGLALTALGVAELLARPQRGLVRVLSAEGPGGVMLLRLGLTAVLGGPLIGALLLAVVKAVGLVDLPLILALGNVLAVFFALLLLVATAVHVQRSHEAAEASAARVREIIEQAAEGIFIADLSGRYMEVNAAGCRLLGYSREELLGKTILDFIPDEDAPRLWRSKEHMLNGTVHTAEWTLRRRDGSCVPIEVTAKILPDGRWQAFVRDITQRVDLERRLLESRDFLQRVLESSTEYGIVADDLERRVVLWNEGARLSYGYELHEISGQPSDLLTAPADVETYEALRAQAIREGSAKGTLNGRRKDGSIFAAYVVCTRRLGADRRTAGVLLVSRDLTAEQRYLAEQEFLARVGIELAACLEYRETLACVLQLAVSFLGDIAAVDTLKDGVLRRIRALHRDPQQSELAQAVEQLGPARAAGHPLWEVLETKQPLLIPEISDEDRKRFAVNREHADVIEQVHATSAMLVPLIARGQLLAVLSISACNGTRQYGQADLRLAMELARRAALSLDNVQLYQQSRLEGAMTSNLAEGVVLIRARDGAIVYANRRFEALFGYDPGELINRHVAVLNAPGEQGGEQQARQIMDTLHRTGAWHGEIKNVRRDGSELWCAASVSAFDHQDYGKVWIAVHSDITERKLLEAKNEQSLRDKEVLLKEVHHRVKNNLQVISSLFSLQRDRTHNDELKRLLEESQTRIESIALVHEQLYRSANLAAIDLDEYLCTLVQAIRSTYGAKDVEIEVNARDVMLDAEEAVPCALLVCELVSNSLKHALRDGRGKLWIRAQRDSAGQCTLEVGDSGVGMPADFDWTKARTLGLRLVQGLARQLRGTVELDRSHGTRFTVRFKSRQAH